MRHKRYGSVYCPPTFGSFVRQTVTWVIVLLALTLAFHSCSEAAAADDAVVTAGPVEATGLPEPCPFSPGWNLTVLHGTPDLLPSCVSAVWYYEGRTERWYFWGRANAPYWNDLTEFDITRGYWAWAH